MQTLPEVQVDRKPEVVEAWNSRPEAYVTIAGPDKYGTWAWKRHTATTILTSKMRFQSADAAAQAAVTIARCYGVAAELPRSTRPAVASFYRKHGKSLYDAGAGFEACRNEFERLGYTLARLEAARVPTEVDLMDADLAALRSGQLVSRVSISDAQLEAADQEWLHTDPRC